MAINSKLSEIFNDNFQKNSNLRVVKEYHVIERSDQLADNHNFNTRSSPLYHILLGLLVHIWLINPLENFISSE